MTKFPRHLVEPVDVADRVRREPGVELAERLPFEAPLPHVGEPDPV